MQNNKYLETNINIIINQTIITMKKITLIMFAALAMTFVACGNKGGNGTESKDGKKAETKYQTYTNEKYGFTVEVPSVMTQRGEAMGDEGTVFSLESNKDEITFNRIDISGDNNMEGENYTIEGVIESLKEWHDFSEFTDFKQGDNYFTYTIPGQYVTQIDYFVVKGPKKVSISVCYEPGFEKQLGGEVAEHVFNSITFK